MRKSSVAHARLWAGALGIALVLGGGLLLAQKPPAPARPGGIQVKARTLPPPGIDTVKVTMVETYDISGVGKDTVQLEGTLVARRGPVLLGHGKVRQSWADSTVVSEFTKLDLKGESKVFGTVHVTLDPKRPSFASVTAGKCAAAVAVQVEMSKLNLTLVSREAVQLQSTVQTVPPIGDEKTASVAPVALVDTSGRSVGRLESARVMWRELTRQEPFAAVAVKTGG